MIFAADIYLFGSFVLLWHLQHCAKVLNQKKVNFESSVLSLCDIDTSIFPVPKHTRRFKIVLKFERIERKNESMVEHAHTKMHFKFFFLLRKIKNKICTPKCNGNHKMHSAHKTKILSGKRGHNFWALFILIICFRKVSTFKTNKCTTYYYRK